MMVSREHSITEPRGSAEAVIFRKADGVGALRVDAHEWLGRTITKDQQIFSAADYDPLRGPCCGSRSKRLISVPAALAAAPLVIQTGLNMEGAECVEGSGLVLRLRGGGDRGSSRSSPQKCKHQFRQRTSSSAGLSNAVEGRPSDKSSSMVTLMPRTAPVKCPALHSLSFKMVTPGSGVCTKCARNLQAVSQSNSVALYYTRHACNNCIYQLCVACAEVVEDCGTVPLPAPPPKPRPPAVTNPFFEP